jgi:hypothetical protein
MKWLLKDTGEHRKPWLQVKNLKIPLFLQRYLFARSYRVRSQEKLKLAIQMLFLIVWQQI